MKNHSYQGKGHKCPRLPSHTALLWLTAPLHHTRPGLPRSAAGYPPPAVQLACGLPAGGAATLDARNATGLPSPPARRQRPRPGGAAWLACGPSIGDALPPPSAHATRPPPPPDRCGGGTPARTARRQFAPSPDRQHGSSCSWRPIRRHRCRGRRPFLRRGRRSSCPWLAFAAGPACLVRRRLSWVMAPSDSFRGQGQGHPCCHVLTPLKAPDRTGVRLIILKK